VNGLGRGWDQILRILHPGERATLVMPAELAALPPTLAPAPPNTARWEIEMTEDSRD
jgi:hypothetical protein